MRKLDFIGTVQGDRDILDQGMHLPGKRDLIVAPADWPNRLAPGTLNIHVNSDGFPEGFDEIGKGDGLGRFDEGKFRSALVIPGRKITGNTLKSTSDQPTRGFAIIWRAELQVIVTGQTTTCWMLRIIGSDKLSQLELVAKENLRDHLNLSDGMAVKVTAWEAESGFKPKTPSEWMADWCEAARGVEERFGTEKAMGYLIGEKFLNVLEVAETNREWRQAIPSFVARIKELFEPWQLAQFLETPRRLGALGHVADDEGHRMLREALDESEKAREDARNLVLLEWAKELLLDESEQY